MRGEERRERGSGTWREMVEREGVKERGEERRREEEKREQERGKKRWLQDMEKGRRGERRGEVGKGEEKSSLAIATSILCEYWSGQVVL